MLLINLYFSVVGGGPDCFWSRSGLTKSVCEDTELGILHWIDLTVERSGIQSVS